MLHPHAVLKHGDKGEVIRKASMLREALFAQGLNCGCDKGLLGEEIRCLILKADVERRLVYSVITEPDTVDVQGDVMRAETIEEMAHNFQHRSRKFDNRHDWKAVDAAPVESWIQREATVLVGERIRARSWVVGVKVLLTISGRRLWPGIISPSALAGGGDGVE